MRRREFIAFIASAIAWPMAARAQKTIPVTDQVATDPRGTGTVAKCKGKASHHHRATNKRLHNDHGKSDDYVYGKVHYRLKSRK